MLVLGCFDDDNDDNHDGTAMRSALNFSSTHSLFVTSFALNSPACAFPCHLFTTLAGPHSKRLSNIRPRKLYPPGNAASSETVTASTDQRVVHKRTESVDAETCEEEWENEPTIFLCIGGRAGGCPPKAAARLVLQPYRRSDRRRKKD